MSRHRSHEPSPRPHDRDAAHEIEDAMRRCAAAALDTGRQAEAERTAEAAARGLDALARELDTVRRGLMQPMLDRFLAAERQAAGLQEQLQKARTRDQQAQAERALSELAESLDNLSPSDGALREAADALRRSIQVGSARGWRRDQTQTKDGGLFIPPVEYDESLRGALAGAPVPDPAARPRPEPDGTRWPGTSSVQVPRRGLLSRPLPRPAVEALQGLAPR